MWRNTRRVIPASRAAAWKARFTWDPEIVVSGCQQVPSARRNTGPCFLGSSLASAAAALGSRSMIRSFSSAKPAFTSRSVVRPYLSWTYFPPQSDGLAPARSRAEHELEQGNQVRRRGRDDRLGVGRGEPLLPA